MGNTQKPKKCKPFCNIMKNAVKRDKRVSWNFVALNPFNVSFFRTIVVTTIRAFHFPPNYFILDWKLKMLLRCVPDMLYAHFCQRLSKPVLLKTWKLEMTKINMKNKTLVKR